MSSKDFKEIFTAEIISVTGGLFVGAILALYVDKIILIPGLLILLPGFLEMRNAITGSLVGRLGSALHLGTIKPTIKNNKFAYQNILATSILCVIVSIVIATIAYFVTYFVFKQSAPELFAIALLAALVSNLAENVISFYTSFWLFRKGFDPDNIMGPYITTTGDIIGVFSLLFATVVVA